RAGGEPDRMLARYRGQGGGTHRHEVVDRVERGEGPRGCEFAPVVGVVGESQWSADHRGTDERGDERSAKRRNGSHPFRDTSHCHCPWRPLAVPAVAAEEPPAPREACSRRGSVLDE